MPIISSLGSMTASAFGRSSDTETGATLVDDVTGTSYNLNTGETIDTFSNIGSYSNGQTRNFTVTVSGGLRMVLWGAGGGDGEYDGGGGGFSSGTIQLTVGQKIAVRGASKGRTGTGSGQGTPGDLSGGLSGGGGADNYNLRGSGGGFSYVALYINYPTGVYLLKAGGGGGSGNGPLGGPYPGGAGGGTNGEDGVGGTTGGTPSAGGSGGACSFGADGSLNQGGTGLTGGGGGHYGGGGGGDCGPYAPSGGGGSGYVNTSRLILAQTLTGNGDEPAEKNNARRSGNSGHHGEHGQVVIYWD